MNKRQRKKLGHKQLKMAARMKPPEDKWAKRQLQSPELHGGKCDATRDSCRRTLYPSPVPSGFSVMSVEPAEEKPKDATPKKAGKEKPHNDFTEREVVVGLIAACVLSALMLAAAFKFAPDTGKMAPEQRRHYFMGPGLK